MNDAFAARSARPRAELLERPLDELVGDEMAALGRRAAKRPRHADRRTTARGRGRFERRRLGGTFAVTMTPLINEDGEPVGRVLVARDITPQTRLEASRRRCASGSRSRRSSRRSGSSSPASRTR